MVYLIFDNIELLHEWNNGFNLISALFKLSDLTRMPNLGLIFINNITPGSFYSHTGALEPLTVYFRDCTDDELYHILIKGQPNTELYASFLNPVELAGELQNSLQHWNLCFKNTVNQLAKKLRFPMKMESGGCFLILSHTLHRP